MRDERRREAAAVARLEHWRLDLEEALLVEIATDLRDGAGANLERTARVLVHQQVEVAPAVALLDIGEPVERVRQRHADLREQLQLGHLERRLPPARLRRVPADADDVAEVDIDLLSDEELDPAAAIDEVEEQDLAQVAARQHAAGEPEGLRLVARAGLDFVGPKADRSDLDPAGKALRQHGGESRVLQRVGDDRNRSLPGDDAEMAKIERQNSTAISLGARDHRRIH